MPSTSETKSALSSPFCFPPGFSERLAEVNGRWRQRLARAWDFGAAWAPGQTPTAAIRLAYEQAFPIATVLDDLRSLALLVLPDASWLPRQLRPSAGCACLPPFASWPDFLQELPESLQGWPPLTPEKLTAFLCCLADPPRFGTAAGRYPGQLEQLKIWIASQPVPTAWRLLDIGCGTGQGTCELVQALEGCQPAPVEALGLTLEPLEAWMATARRLPHDPSRERQWIHLDTRAHPQFVAGNALEAWPERQADLIFANGLVGGDFLQGKPACRHFLENLRHHLAPGGRAFLANTFHDGYRRHVELFATEAKAQNWHLKGPWQALEMERRG